MPPKSRNTDTITFSLPPEMAQNLRQVVKEEDRTVSELLREAIRLYMEEREWRRRERLERLRTRQTGHDCRPSAIMGHVRGVENPRV